ncbi:MAG: TonB family protein [Chryseolinea sp.]
MNIPSFTLILLINTSLTLSSVAQRLVTGKVVDNQTKKPIKEAKIIIEGTSIETTTNTLGFFQLQIDSIQNLIISHSEYEIGSIKIPEVDKFQIALTKINLPSIQKDSTFVVIEEPASFPGGFGQLAKYFAKNTRAPKDARNIHGKVMVEFVVDKTGAIPPEEIKVIQGLSKSCDEEAIRLIREFPKWNPGKQNGRPVKSRFVMPVNFK